MAVSLLTACNDDSKSSDSNSPDDVASNEQLDGDNTGSSNTESSLQACSDTNSIISLQEGERCLLSNEQLTLLRLNNGSNELRCSNGRVQVGGVSAERFTGHGLSAQCASIRATAPQPVPPSPEVPPCRAADSVINVNEGESCLLSTEQLANLRLNNGSNELQCSNGRVQVGGVSSQRFTGISLTAQCANLAVTPPDTSDEVLPSPVTEHCVEKNATITLTEGEHCVLSTEQLNRLNISMSGDTLHCSNERLQLGGISVGSIAVNGLTVQCTAGASDHHQFATTRSDVHWYTSEKTSGLQQATVYGNAEPVLFDNNEVAQVHANMFAGVFYLNASLHSSTSESAQQVRLVLSQSETLQLDSRELEQSISIEANHDVQCSHTATGNVTCAGIDLTQNTLTPRLPAQMNLHLLQCQQGSVRDCQSSIVIPVQFN
jgi:hypothetical protein